MSVMTFKTLLYLIQQQKKIKPALFHHISVMLSYKFKAASIRRVSDQLVNIVEYFAAKKQDISPKLADSS